MGKDELQEACGATNQSREWRKVGLLAVYVLLALATLTSAWIVHQWASNTLPLPWDDEVAFFWPAVHWAQDCSLFAPELNPERDLMWMPPGMMVALGTLFKVFPAQLPVARWVSWTMLAIGFGCCICWFSRIKRGLLCALLLSGFFLNGAFTAAGNIARMDSWIWGMGAAAFMLLHSGKTGWHRQLGWSLLGVMPLVHPNGLYFLLAAGLAEIGCRLTTKWHDRNLDYRPIYRKRRKTVLWPILITMLWGVYGIYIATHKTAFASDMAWQFSSGMNIFSSKGDGPTWKALLTWPTFGCVLWYVFFGLHALWKAPRNLWLVGWGGASLMTYVIRHEMWYEIFWQTGWLWLVILGFQIGIPLRRGVGRITTTLVHAMLFVWAGTFFLRHGFIEGPLGYTKELSWGWGMVLEQDIPYVTKDDVACFKTVLDRTADIERRPIRIMFKPAGDQLLFLECFDKDKRPFYPIFSEETADFTTVHVSRYRPNWLETGSSVPQEAVPFHERNGTEKWYFFATPNSQPPSEAIQ